MWTLFPSKVASEFALKRMIVIKLELHLTALQYFKAPSPMLGEACFIFRHENSLALHSHRICMLWPVAAWMSSRPCLCWAGSVSPESVP